MPVSEKLLQKIETLPTLPIVVTRIMQLVENPKTAAVEISKVVSLDPALTVKILKIVNSAYYGFPKQITTITHAIMILGFEDVKNIAMGISVFDIFKSKGAKDAVEFDRVAFWQHSIAVGSCTKLLAKKLRYKNPEEAFICGLLHDIGKIILDQYFHEEFNAVIKLAKDENLLFVNAEKRLNDMDHPEIGRIVAKKWGLPSTIIDCITSHHNPAACENNQLVVALVHASDVFCKIQKIGNSGDTLVPQLQKTAWDQLKLQPTDLTKLYEELHEEVKKADTFMEFAKTA
ncbi:MAG TPA: HDOD domain-containing protein [Candidatus Wallbacteria bacterium]|nr:HDOD domain-containing protein [Candidatus Wallbacteria bacterium]